MSVLDGFVIETVNCPFVAGSEAGVVAAIVTCAVSLSVMFAVAEAVVIVTAPFEGFEIVACSVSSASRSASSSTGTVNVPVVAPAAMLRTPDPLTSV